MFMKDGKKMLHSGNSDKTKQQISKQKAKTFMQKLN